MNMISRLVFLLLVSFFSLNPFSTIFGDEPYQGAAKKFDLGKSVSLEVIYIPSGMFKMGSTAAEKQWATGIEGGAKPGTVREKYEGESRPIRVSKGFWMGRTEVTRGQFRRFVEESGYVTDAEKPGGVTQVFDHKWDRYYYGTKIVNPWKSVEDKSWRDPGFDIPMKDDYPVVCVSYQDMKAFCNWLTGIATAPVPSLSTRTSS